ncbi:hypothetical protein A2U01_0092921, partial [Trifolium medium]|nr:hypothetical protein [Trifolium medium]
MVGCVFPSPRKTYFKWGGSSFSSNGFGFSSGSSLRDSYLKGTLSGSSNHFTL